MRAVVVLSWDWEGVREPGPRGFLHLQWVCKAIESPWEKEECRVGSGNEFERATKRTRQRH